MMFIPWINWCGDIFNRILQEFNFFLHDHAFVQIFTKKSAISSFECILNHDSFCNILAMLLRVYLLDDKHVEYSLHNLYTLQDKYLYVAKYYERDFVGEIKPVYICGNKEFITTHDVNIQYNDVAVLTYLDNTQNSVHVDLSNEYNVIGHLLNKLQRFNTRDFVELCIEMFNKNIPRSFAVIDYNLSINGINVVDQNESESI